MPVLIRGVARTAVVAGTASAVAGRVNRHQQQKWASQDQQAYEQQQYAPPPPAPAPTGPAPDMMEQLKQLGDLHAQGILTDEEFAAQKARILGT